MIDFPENIKNFNLLSVTEFKWDDLDKAADPRPYHALSFRVHGDCIYTVNTEQTIINSNDLLFVPANLGYHQNRKSEHLFCILFLADNLPSDKLYTFTPSNPNSFTKLFSSMHDCWTKKRAGHIAESTSYFYRIISKILSQQAELQSAAYHNTLNDALEYIHENFTDSKLSVVKLSDIASVSESYFRKQFKELTGVSPLQYINNLRTDYALELLNTNYYKIYEIAEIAGFSDCKYFSTVIKKKTGHPPKFFVPK